MVIDLDAPSSPPEASRRGPGLADLATARPLAVVAALLAVLTLGGSAAPLPGLRRVLAVENTSGVFALAPAALFTADFGPAPGRQTLVRRHSLDGPASRWSTEVPQTVGSLDLAGPAQVLTVGPAQVLMTTSVDYLQTTFLDSETGEILWSTRTGSVLRLADTSALMTGGTADSVVLRRADLRTGRTLWSQELRSILYLDAGDPAAGPISHIVMADQQGRTTVLDFADGTILATAELGVAPTHMDDDGLSDIAMYASVGDHLYLARRDNGLTSLTAYRLPDLQQSWRSIVAPLGRPTWCGRHLLCIATATGLTVLDSGTGVFRWSDDRWRWGFDTRAIGMTGQPRIAVGDSELDTVAVLDPATGATLVTLGASTLVGTKVLRSDRRAIGRTWVQVTGPHNGIRTVGTLDTVAPGRCAADADYLACPTASGRLDVWRVPK